MNVKVVCEICETIIWEEESYKEDVYYYCKNCWRCK